MSQQTVEDRRRRRHVHTRDEIVEHALAVMAESGAAGLSLGEVARRMGMRTPSLYVYFPSKAALYDEVFARGWRTFEQVMQEYDGPLPRGTSLRDRLVEVLTRSLEWASAHPAYSQLMFWRPVPQWRPTPEHYAPALAVVALSRRAFERFRADGRLRADADVDEAVDVWAVLVTGLISQRLSNEPEVPLSSGRTLSLVAPLVSSFAAHYEPRPSS